MMLVVPVLWKGNAAQCSPESFLCASVPCAHSVCCIESGDFSSGLQLGWCMEFLDSVVPFGGGKGFDGFRIILGLVGSWRPQERRQSICGWWEVISTKNRSAAFCPLTVV